MRKLCEQIRYIFLALYSAKSSIYLLRIQTQNQPVQPCVVSHCVFLNITNSRIPQEPGVPVSAAYDRIISVQSTYGQRCFRSRRVAILFVWGKADIINHDFFRTTFVHFPPIVVASLITRSLTSDNNWPAFDCWTVVCVVTTTFFSWPYQNNRAALTSSNRA